jgi:hypothetical protein
MVGYLRSDWIREAVDEFQSPKFRSESALLFEILLFAGLIAAGLLLRRRRVADTLMVVFWAHAALVSVRHVPVFVVAACPILAAEASRWWTRWAQTKPARSLAGILDGVATDFTAGFGRTSAWPAALVVTLALLGSPLRWPRDFPEIKFPVGLVGRQQEKLAGARVFTSDQWGDYLLYRFYPRQKVFLDGRSGPGKALSASRLRAHGVARHLAALCGHRGPGALGMAAGQHPAPGAGLAAGGGRRPGGSVRAGGAAVATDAWLATILLSTNLLRYGAAQLLVCSFG